jgi:dipeptidase E
MPKRKENKATRHIVAMGGGGFSMEPDNPLLDNFILGLTRKRRPKVCFVPTASGDSDNYVARFYRAFPASRCSPSHLQLFHGDIPDLTRLLCDQDVVYVGGGSTANMLVVWRLHGMDKALHRAWVAGVVLCGVSAGALCWFEGGITDSFGQKLSALHDGLGFLKGGFCPHYDGEVQRRPTLHREIVRGLPPTIAADDGAAVHFVNQKFAEVVSSRPSARAYRVRSIDGKVREEMIDTRYLG